MINWNKGLTPTQQEALDAMLAEEAKIPIETMVFNNGDIARTVTGRYIGKNKLVQERDSGYTHYIETEDGLVSLSAFSWKLSKD